jgi:hypothetical protein
VTSSQRVYEVRLRRDKRGYDLISAALPFGRLWYAEPNAISNAIGYAKFFSRSHDAVIRVYERTSRESSLSITLQNDNFEETPHVEPNLP